MPYNNTPIAPPQEYTGTVSLPLARVKKIIQADEDIHACSNNACFVVAVATEMFVQYLVERTHDVVKSERKPRRNIQYKDVGKSNAVARIDNLEFLSDVVPRTMPWKDAKKLLDQKAAANTSNPKLLPSGQMIIGGASASAALDSHAVTEEDKDRNGYEAMQVDPEEIAEDESLDPATQQLEMEERASYANGASGATSHGGGGLSFANGV